jgi:adenosine deaminase
VTVNSDDPAYFGGYVDDNYAALVDHLGFAPCQVSTLARNSILASLLPAAARDRLLAEIVVWEGDGAGPAARP